MNYAVKLITTNTPYLQEQKEGEKNARSKRCKNILDTARREMYVEATDFFYKTVAGMNNFPSFTIQVIFPLPSKIFFYFLFIFLT